MDAVVVQSGDFLLLSVHKRQSKRFIMTEGKCKTECLARMKTHGLLSLVMGAERQRLSLRRSIASALKREVYLRVAAQPTSNRTHILYDRSTNGPPFVSFQNID